ncbi:hypothetical protein [Devosia psychrophila]|uniref:Uncharacterized protein n=1 Tax=Devosia psychrophila TaxID=728005 RepID=A0A1I1SFG9_9HYPH|nr:hypothetical protein [Devosia psychrophila]SFD45196.1 hypothetical protein SAMN04488059_1658 [Devosia psychrophila]
MPNPSPAPATVKASFYLWVGAVVTAVAELSVRLVDAPEGFAAAVMTGVPELAVRGFAYILLLALGWFMLSGHNWARWTLLIIFGGLGTFSLVFEPLQWLAEGGAMDDFFATASTATWAMSVSRVLHVACVWSGVALMFGGEANAYFRIGRQAAAVS